MFFINASLNHPSELYVACQHGRWPACKIRGMLAWLDEGQRLCGEVDANIDVGRPWKSGACWRDQAEDKGFAVRIAPTCLCPSIGKQKCRPQNRRLRSAFLFSIRLLRLLSHCFSSIQRWQCSIRCIRLVRGAAPRCRFSRSRTIFAPAELASSDSAS